MSILLPTDLSKILLNEWKSVEQSIRVYTVCFSLQNYKLHLCESLAIYNTIYIDQISCSSRTLCILQGNAILVLCLLIASMRILSGNEYFL